MSPSTRRTALIICISVILIGCTASAYFSIKAGHNAKAASTFFAGVSMSILIWTLSQRVKQ